jgi:hypothetical protein
MPVFPVSFGIRLHLDHINHDSVGAFAVFHGSPPIRGQSIAVPVSEGIATLLVPGRRYVFALEREEA